MAYYNSMLTGSDHSISKCNDVYERMKGYKVYVIAACGYGVDASCNKRIRYDGNGGITAVRGYFATVIKDLGVSLHATVNSKPSCQF